MSFSNNVLISFSLKSHELKSLWTVAKIERQCITSCSFSKYNTVCDIMAVNICIEMHIFRVAKLSLFIVYQLVLFSLNLWNVVRPTLDFCFFMDKQSPCRTFSPRQSWKQMLSLSTTCNVRCFMERFL